LTGKPKSIAIEKCHLYLGQRYVITIEWIVMRLIWNIFFLPLVYSGMIFVGLRQLKQKLFIIVWHIFFHHCMACFFLTPSICEFG
jgi:hypothetical protein